MSVIRAISNTSGNARDVACDEAGRLIIAGVTVDLSGAGLTVDLTSTNALLNQIVASLDPVSGNFEVTIANTVTLKDTPPIKVDLQVLNPALLFPVRVNSFAPGSTLDVNVKTLDPTLNLKVTIADIIATTPLRVLVDSFSPTAVVKVDLANISTAGLLNVNVSALNNTLFPNGFPIDIRNFSAPAPLPFRLDSINTTIFPNGIPVNLSTSGSLSVTLDTSTIPLRVTIADEPIDVNINVPPAGLPVSWNTSQLASLLNTINNASVGLDAGTEVIIRDADGVLSSSNPLRVQAALLGADGNPLTAANALPSNIIIGGSVISAANRVPVALDPATVVDAKLNVLTLETSVISADNVLRPLQLLNTGDLITGRRLYDGPTWSASGSGTNIVPAQYNVTWDYVFDNFYYTTAGYFSTEIDVSKMSGEIYVYFNFTAGAVAPDYANGITVSFNPFESGNTNLWVTPSQQFTFTDAPNRYYAFARASTYSFGRGLLRVPALGKRMRVLIWSTNSIDYPLLTATGRLMFTKI